MNVLNIGNPPVSNISLSKMNHCSDEEYFYKLDSLVIRSSQYLRQIFKRRWKLESGEEWEDNPNYIQTFLAQHCESMFRKAIPQQKKILHESCSLEEWDISLMSLVLLNFGDGKKYKLQNQAIRQLKSLRNDLSHHKSKTLIQSEYTEKVKMLKEILQTLEIPKSEITKLIKESSVNLSTENTEQLKVLLKNAEQFIKVQDFKSALLHYSEAIAIPRLSRDSLGEIYEKRAACYLNINDMHNSDGKHTDQAILDVQEALKLNKKSWNAHYLQAHCHKSKHNLSEAIRCYEIALAISPVQKHIKRELDSCKILHEKQKTNVHLNLNQLPLCLNDIVGEARDKFGRKLTMKKVADLCGFQTFPTFLGEKYFHGLEVRQDYAKAAKCFAQADEQGYAEGTYKLGYCYYHGHGVEQDVGKALEIWKRCAKLDPKQTRHFEIQSSLGFNDGVASAECAIGKCYEQGTGVEKNLSKAALWYTKAMQHGEANAARSLGLLYVDGLGVPRNEKMAEMCWKQSLNFGCTLSTELLIEYYRRQIEPQMAWHMLKIAREMGHSKFLEMSDEDFSRYLALIQSDRWMQEEDIAKFENYYNFDIKGMTFKQRITRANQHLDTNDDKMSRSTNNSFGGQVQNIKKDVMTSVVLKGAFGSETALGVVVTTDCIFELNDLLAKPDDSSKTYKLKVVNLLYECMLLEDHLKSFITNVIKYEKVVTELFFETCQQINEEEMKIRLCYVGYNLWPSLKSADDLYALRILNEGLCRYPDNYGYIRLQIYCLKKRKSYKKAMKCVDEALEKFPEKVDLFFLKADILLNCENVESSKIIAAFKLFLDKAPQDHRFVPAAFYEISFVHMKDYMKHYQTNNSDYNNMDILKLIEDHFKRGKTAELEQLPCYQPYGVSDSQLIVEGFLEENVENGKLDCDLDDSTIFSTHLSKRVLERKEYLKSPVRRGLILQHRQRRRVVFTSKQTNVPFDDKSVPAKFQQTRAKKMSHLRNIFLQEMNPTKDRIFENTILELTIIEKPIQFSNSIQLVAEDENGDSTRVYFDDVEVVTVLLGRLEVGSRIAVVNPYMGTCAKVGVYGIRINEPKCVIFLEKVQNMCSFCGEENAAHNCSKCKQLYCSRECEKLDWQLFEHQLICSPAIPAKSHSESTEF